MKKSSFNVLRLTALTKFTTLALAITLALSGCGFAAKNLAKQVSDLAKQTAELQVKAADIEEKAAALSPRDRRTYQAELARLGFEAPEWLFSDADALSSGAPEEDVDDIPGGILGGLARIIRGIGGGRGGGGSDSGTFTLTGIPSQYNGKYAMAMGGDMGKDIAIVGAQTYTRNPVSISLVPIRGGRVTLNLWETDSFRQSPYTGNDALSVLVYISDQATGEDINEGEHTIGFNEVSFKNGGATKAWRDGIVGLVSSSTDGGTFTLTGIPAQYNGKYATLMGEDSRKNMALMGAQAITWPAGGEPTATLAPIRGGRAAINLWMPTPAGLSPYKGNDTLKVSVGIFDQAVVGPDESPMEEYTVEFANVSFRNGSATQAWSAGTVTEITHTYSSAWSFDETQHWHECTDDDGAKTGVANHNGVNACSVCGYWKWTNVTDSTFGSAEIKAIAFGNNRFVAGGTYGRMAYSEDNGVTWTRVADSTFGNYSNVEAIAFGNNRFVAVGGGRMAYSTDGGANAVGESWTAVANAPSGNWSGIAYGGNRFVAVGEDGAIAYSDDGARWTAVANSAIWQYTNGNTTYTGNINAIAYGSNRFVAVGNPGKMAYSTDGVTWTAVADSTTWQFTNGGSTSTLSIESIAYGNNRFVAVGQAGKMAYSTDGIRWTAVSDSTVSYPIAFGNGRFVAGKDYSPDGQSWTTGANWVPGNSIAYGNGRFVAGGYGSIAYADW